MWTNRDELGCGRIGTNRDVDELGRMGQGPVEGGPGTWGGTVERVRMADEYWRIGTHAAGTGGRQLTGHERVTGCEL